MTEGAKSKLPERPKRTAAVEAVTKVSSYAKAIREPVRVREEAPKDVPGPRKCEKRVREPQLNSVAELGNVTMEDYFRLGLDQVADGADPCTSPTMGPSTPEPVGNSPFLKTRRVSPKPASAKRPVGRPRKTKVATSAEDEAVAELLVAIKKDTTPEENVVAAATLASLKNDGAKPLFYTGCSRLAELCIAIEISTSVPVCQS